MRDLSLRARQGGTCSCLFVLTMSHEQGWGQTRSWATIHQRATREETIYLEEGVCGNHHETMTREAGAQRGSRETPRGTFFFGFFSSSLNLFLVTLRTGRTQHTTPGATESLLAKVTRSPHQNPLCTARLPNPRDTTRSCDVGEKKERERERERIPSTPSCPPKKTAAKAPPPLFFFARHETSHGSGGRIFRRRWRGDESGGRR